MLTNRNIRKDGEIIEDLSGVDIENDLKYEKDI